MANAANPTKKEQPKPAGNSIKNKFTFKWNYCLLTFLVPFVLYLSSIKNDYNLDDNLVTQNQRLTSQGISAIPEIFKSNYYSDNMGYSYEYRPIVLSSFAIEHQFFGDNPHVSHFINVLLYAFLCFLLYRCLRRFFKNTNYLFSFIITLIFALHPAHTEVVCSIKNRDELFSMIFGLLAFRFAMLFADKKSYKDLLLMGGCFILGVLSKKSVLIFGAMIPVFLLVYSSEIFVTILTGAILYLGGIMINQGIEIHDGGLVFLILPVFFTLYLFLGIKDAESRTALLKPFYGFINTDEVSTNKSLEGVKHLIKKIYTSNTSALWALSVLNLVVFGAFLYFGIMLLTLPALIAMCLFVVIGNRNLQVFNLLAYTITLGITFFLYQGEPAFLVSVSILGLVYYYNVQDMRKMVLACALLIICSYFLKPITFAQGAAVMAFFVIQTRYKSRMVNILSAVTILGWNLFFIHKFLGHRYASDPTFESVKIFINRFAIFILLLGFTLLPRKIKQPYSLIMVVIFSLMLLLRMGGMSQRMNVSRDATTSIGKTTITEPARNSRPFTISEAPVNQQSPFRIRMGTSFMISLKYFEKTLVPWPLGFYYGYKYIQPTDIFTIQSALGILIYLFITLFAFLILYKSKGLFVGLLLFVVSVVAVADFFYILPGMMADRFLFVPSLGFAIALGSGLSLLFKIDWSNFNLKPGNLPTGVKFLLGTIFIVYAGLTAARTADWQDKLTLFRHDIKYLDESCQAHNLLATNLVIYSFGVQSPDSQVALRNEALVHFKRAINIYPGYMNQAYDAGRTYALLHNDDSALVYFKMAHDVVDSFPDDNTNIANILLNKGRLEEALPYLDQVIKYEPTNQNAYGQKGFALFSLKRYPEALNATKVYMKQFPTNLYPYINAGKIFEAMGNKDSALVYYRQAYAMNSNNPPLKAIIDELEKKH